MNAEANGKIDEMKPGRELDALVAEKVLGCKTSHGDFKNAWGAGTHRVWWCSCEKVPAHYVAAFTPYPFKHGKGPGIGEINNYSTSISAAWEVVEKIVSGDMHEYEPAFCRALGWGSHLLHVNANVPMRICSAALKAVTS